MSVLHMCEVAGFSRSGYYRFLDPVKPALADMDLRNEIQKIALEWPSYGSRRITAELKARQWDVNRKRVQRIMREDNLLCVVKRRFVVPTTDSDHSLKVYPNLAAKMILTGVDQLWVADITYIRLEEEFVYLAVISGCLFAARDRLASRPVPGQLAHAERIAHGPTHQERADMLNVTGRHLDQDGEITGEQKCKRKSSK